MTFEEFLNILPGVQPGKHIIQAAAKSWADYITDPNPRFVAPPLRGETQAILGQTSAVILSAPGAVGKSTVGAEIARRKYAPVVNLAARKVGTDGAVGLITKMFGYTGVASVASEISAGTFLLVLDALDETRVGSGDGNFDAFLDDLSDLLKSARAKPSVLLLARTDTAEWMEYYLHSFGVPIGHYVIDFFEETAAREFVTRYVGDRSKGTVETGSQPFVRARDELLEAIKGAVTPDGGDGRLAITVLGYAPVLEAVSQYLLDEENRRNYHRLLQALKRDAREWELLLQVSEVLLDREQQKQTKQFQESLKSKAGPGWRDWSKLYSPEEQFQRLLAKRFKAQQPPLPAELPVTLRTDYERAVQVALGDHPFVGSVNGLHPLFGEYLYARLFTDDSTTTSPIAESAREMLRTETYLPTRALARFVHALTTRQGPPRVSARDFGFVYESVLSDQQKPGDVLLRLRSSGAPDELHGWMNAGGRPLDFRIIQTAQGLWFWRNLSHASGSFECPVDLGVQGGDFRLGPAVNLECSTLQCPAELRIYLGDDREGEEVVLVASSFGATARAPVVRGKRFYVRGNSVPWPWSDYRVPEPPTAQATAKIIDLYNHLTRILLWFRAAGYEEIARVDEIVENAATGGTEIARDLLRFCVEKGLIERGKLYTLNSEKLAAYEIHYNDLSLRILRDPAIKFLAEFLDWRKK